MLSIAQISRDCHWEPFPGRPTCPTSWSLNPDIVHTDRRVSYGPWSDYGLTIVLEQNPRGFGTQLRLSRDRETRRGAYELTVECTYGMFQRTLLSTFDVI